MTQDPILAKFEADQVSSHLYNAYWRAAVREAGDRAERLGLTVDEILAEMEKEDEND